MRRSLLSSLVLLAALPVLLSGQETPTQTPPAGPENLRVFVDNCPCSLDYLRTEINYIDYVRDRSDADVHVLFTYQSTGAGGTAYTLYFIGLRRFAGAADTLTFATPPSETEDRTRQMLVRYLKMGLMRYVARTPSADRIRISLATPTAGEPATPAAPAADPWNFWVFRTSLGGNANGEKTSKSVSTNGSLSATRTTEMWKARVSASGNYREQRFTFSSGRVTNVYSHSINSSALLVRSISDHFSAGMTANASRSSFLNQDLSVRVAPALEYSLFPYRESTRRLLTLQYSTGFDAFDYTEETLYFQTAERRFDHQLLLSYQVTQPWGNAFASVSGQQYLHDLNLYSASAFGNASLRLFKGFNLNFFASASQIHNQLYLPRGTASDEDVLLRRRQLETSYRYSGNVSVSYTFGSILNNIVNPRFGGGGGGGEVFFFF